MMTLATRLLGAAAALALSAGIASAAPARVQTDLHVRAGPGTSYPVIGTLPAGSTVDAHDCSGGWCMVRGGYASAAYLSFAGGPGPVVEYEGPAYVGPGYYDDYYYYDYGPSYYVGGWYGGRHWRGRHWRGRRHWVGRPGYRWRGPKVGVNRRGINTRSFRSRSFGSRSFGGRSFGSRSFSRPSFQGSKGGFNSRGSSGFSSGFRGSAGRGANK